MSSPLDSVTEACLAAAESRLDQLLSQGGPLELNDAALDRLMFEDWITQLLAEGDGDMPLPCLVEERRRLVRRRLKQTLTSSLIDGRTGKAKSVRLASQDPSDSVHTSGSDAIYGGGWAMRCVEEEATSQLAVASADRQEHDRVEDLLARMVSFPYGDWYPCAELSRWDLTATEISRFTVLARQDAVDVRVQDTLCHVLSRAASMCEPGNESFEQTARIMQMTRGAAAVVDAMHMHKRSQTFQSHACQALLDVTASEPLARFGRRQVCVPPRNQCVVCRNRQVGTAFQPCGCRSACLSCARRMVLESRTTAFCPICRQAADKFDIVFSTPVQPLNDDATTDSGDFSSPLAAVTEAKELLVDAHEASCEAAGAVEVLASALLRWPHGDRTLALAACGALANMIKQRQKSAEKPGAFYHEALAAVASVMANYPLDAAVQKVCSSFVWGLALADPEVVSTQPGLKGLLEHAAVGACSSEGCRPGEFGAKEASMLLNTINWKPAVSQKIGGCRQRWGQWATGRHHVT
eukprot:TRINITY_DN62547_c0_g1_i2.p1 TRINITY_DN62547_c0_g1~~TRINITY_DN62547_c0_g1_i2.p1  ORF type:complete len:523 (-),score=77.00 TRINITY_DN62547_c0_g1_i2:919-2487(-)